MEVIDKGDYNSTHDMDRCSSCHLSIKLTTWQQFHVSNHDKTSVNMWDLLLIGGVGFLWLVAVSVHILIVLNAVFIIEFINGSDHGVVASYLELYEEGEVEHINGVWPVLSVEQLFALKISSG